MIIDGVKPITSHKADCIREDYTRDRVCRGDSNTGCHWLPAFSLIVVSSHQKILTSPPPPQFLDIAQQSRDDRRDGGDDLQLRDQS